MVVCLCSSNCPSCLYFALKNSPEIATHSFLWFMIWDTRTWSCPGRGPYLFCAIQGVPVGINSQQQKQIAMLGYISPLMIGLFSFNAPAALPVVLSVGGLFLIFQTLLFKRLYKQNESLFPSANNDKVGPKRPSVKIQGAFYFIRDALYNIC